MRNFTNKYLFYTLKTPAPPKVKFNLQDILYFFVFVKPVWKLGAVCFLLSLIPTIIGSFSPLGGKVLIDFVLMKGDVSHLEKLLSSLYLGFLITPVRYILGSLTLVMLCMILAGLVMGLVNIIDQILMTKFRQEITYSVQVQLFDRILRFPLSFIKKQQVGYLMSRATSDVNIIQSIFSSYIVSLVNSFIRLCLSFTILYTLNIKMCLIIVSVVPLNLLINRFYMKKMTSISYASFEESARLSSDLQEVLSGMEVIKSHAAEERELHKITGKLRTVFNLSFKSSLLGSVSGYIMGNLNRIMMLVITWLAAREVMHKSISIGDLTAFVAYAGTVSGNLGTFFSTIINVQPALVSFSRLLEMFRVIPEYERDEQGKQYLVPVHLKGEILFDNVTFSYKPQEPVLKNIFCTVHPGDIIALTGVTGAGKTTLINLILKFNIPQNGTIYLDGNKLSDIDPRWLRSQIGIVSQDIFLFNDTIEHNIKYSNPHAPFEEVVHVAQQAHIHHEIERFENGYNTIVGERGIKLSVGQRQRISLARAFLKNAPLLIFDEPTSALDPETEQLLKDSLWQLTHGRTTFIITHHLSMVDIATRIFHLADGRILERPGKNG